MNPTPDVGVPVTEKTLLDKIGKAVELSTQIKDILNVNLPSTADKNPSPSSKIAMGHMGIELLTSNLRDIKEEVLHI